MSSRRNFIQGAVALALVSAVPSLPLDGWESFLIELRSRVMCLANDGFLVHDLVISPEQDGKRMVQVWDTSEFSLVKSVVWWQKIGAQ